MTPEERGCYCGIWEKDPGFYKKQGIPEGFCGMCDRCGAPGHTRHFPGPVPMTGTWCDRCYKIVGIMYPAKRFGILALIAALIWWAFR